MNAMRDQIEYARGYHLPDRAGLVNELRSMQARGDAVVMLDKVRLRLAIRKAERQLAIETGSTPAGIALRQTVATERSALYAFLALLISLAAFAVSALAYFKPMMK